MKSKSKLASQLSKPHQGDPAAERAARAKALKQAYGHNRIEGVEPSEFGRTVHQEWVEGRISGDEAVARLNRHYRGL